MAELGNTRRVVSPIILVGLASAAAVVSISALRYASADQAAPSVPILGKR